MHGRAAFAFSPEEIVLLRRHLEPGGGTFFADAACGSAAFDAAFRKFVAELLPDNPLVPIPHDDEIYTRKVGFDLANVQYSKAAGGRRDFPQLEGVKLDGHWAVIYSKYDLGCALERHQGLDCKGYSYESACISPPTSSSTRRCRDAGDRGCGRPAADNMHAVIPHARIGRIGHFCSFLSETARPTAKRHGTILP